MQYMKTTALRTWTVTCLAALAAATGFRAWADDAAVTKKHEHEKCYTGTVAAMDAPEHTLRVKGFWASKRFNLADNCTVTLGDGTTGAAGDLRPGQKVSVNYRNAEGVLVADQIRQVPLRYTGMVKAIDPQTHQLTLHHKVWDKTFALGSDCKVMLRDNKTGTLADVKPGFHVTVVYEEPGGKLTAREINETSATFEGELTALDLSARTVQAKHALGSPKRFNLADDCAIMINGKPDGHLRDLRPGEKLLLNYEPVDGVNVVTRIAPAGTPEAAMTAQATK